LYNVFYTASNQKQLSGKMTSM